MWDDLWYDGHAITCDPTKPALGIIENAAIGVQAGKIVWVGALDALPDHPAKLAKNTHVLQGRYLSPGLIDCHTHLVYAGDRSNEFEQRLQGISYETIARRGGGIQSTVQATRLCPEETLLNVSLQRLQSMMHHGVTTVEIKSGYGLNLETELKMLRVARKLGDITSTRVVTTFLGAHAIPVEYKNRADEYVDQLCEIMIPQIAEANLADAVDVFCETIGFSHAQTEKIFKCAQAHHLPVKIHAEQLSNQGGATLAAKYHALSADHLEHLQEDDVKAMAKSDMAAVLLPGAYYFLKDHHCPPIDLFRRYQVPMAIATDCNPGSSPTTNLPLMMNMACILFGLTPTEAWQGVTLHAAKALGISDKVGSLEVNKAADFAIWDITTPVSLVSEFGFDRCFTTVRAGYSCAA